MSTVSVRAIRNLEQGQVVVPRQDTVRLLANALRLTAQERVSFEAAAGTDAEDALFATLTMPVPGARPLHGRDREVDTVLRRLLGQHEPLTAITGFAGVGKTRVAMAVAQKVHARSAMSVLWVSLGHDGADPALDHADRLVRLIGDRPVLLVLDGNDQQKVARESVWELLRECPNLRVLETARVPYGASGDYQLALQPLPVPDAQDLTGDRPDTPAMALLIELVTELRPGFEPDAASRLVLSEVCRRLDGLPGALVAAASWSTIISADELLGMARTEPHLLARPPGDIRDAAAVVRDTVAAQPPGSYDLLNRLVDWPGRWTVADVVARTGMSRAQIGQAVHAFLQRGLITKVTSGSNNLVGFRVLNIVRASLRHCPDAVA